MIMRSVRRCVLAGALAWLAISWWSGPVGTFLGSRGEPFDATDFAVFYAAGKLVASGHAGQLYQVSALEESEHRSVPLPPGMTPAYLNPPFFAAAISPLTHLSFDRAYQVWTLFNALLLAITCGMLWGLARGLPPAQRALLVAGFGASLPVAVALQLGQFSMIIMTSWMGAFVLLRRGADRAAGLALAPLLIKPELIVPAVLFLAWKRRTQVFVTLVPATICAVVISVAVVGTAEALRYPSHLSDAARVYAPGTTSVDRMFGWSGLLGATLGPRHTAEITVVATVLGAATLAVASMAWRGPLRTDSGQFALQWLVLTAATMLADPHLYLQDTVLIYPAIAAALALSSGRNFVLLAGAALACWLITGMGLGPSVHFHLNLIAGYTVVLLAVVVAKAKSRQPGELSAQAEAAATGDVFAVA